MDKRLLSGKLMLTGAAALAAGSCAQQAQSPAQRPNVVFILADDLGWGDLSCYGQQRFQTPNIDALASRGMRFTQCYSGTTVSAPSRSCLITGTHSGHTAIRGNMELDPEGQFPLPADAHTFFKDLKEAGYTTGAFGKWGLGFVGTTGDPNLQGVDTFYGYNCQLLAHSYYPDHLWDNGKRVELATDMPYGQGDYAPDLIHSKALEFLDKAAAGGEPFGYCSQETPHAAFAAMVVRLDRYVGEIVQHLKDLGVYDNTVIIFSSDNGPHKEGGADPDFFDSNGPWRGYKRDVYEGGIRVPMIVSWEGHVKPGTETDFMCTFWDLMPTFRELAGSKTDGEGLDGFSILPLLEGRKGQQEHESLYFEFQELGGRQAVRKGDWKLVHLNIRTDNPVYELYNLADDPGETNDLSAAYPDILADLQAIMYESHIPNPAFPVLKGETAERPSI